MQQEKLYRKVNTRARNVRHKHGGDFRHQRHSKEQQQTEITFQSMGGEQRRGLDYTPLFRFLLAKVGHRWDDVYSWVVPRLDRPDPIFWLVARFGHERKEMVRLGESSYFSGLFIDDDGILLEIRTKVCIVLQ